MVSEARVGGVNTIKFVRGLGKRFYFAIYGDAGDKERNGNAEKDDQRRGAEFFIEPCAAETKESDGKSNGIAKFPSKIQS